MDLGFVDLRSHLNLVFVAYFVFLFRSRILGTSTSIQNQHSSEGTRCNFVRPRDRKTKTESDRHLVDRERSQSGRGKPRSRFKIAMNPRPTWESTTLFVCTPPHSIEVHSFALRWLGGCGWRPLFSSMRCNASTSLSTVRPSGRRRMLSPYGVGWFEVSATRGLQFKNGFLLP